MMGSIIQWIVTILLVNLTNNLSHAKVVVFFPVPGTSHTRCQVNIARELAQLGHETWVCIPDYLTKSGRIDTSGIKVIHYGKTLGNIEEEVKAHTGIHESFFNNKTQSLTTVLLDMQSFFNKLALAIMAEGLSDKVKAVNPDLFVMDNLPFLKLIHIISYKLDIPHAVVGPNHDVVSARIPFSPAATPLQFGETSDEMDFWSRFISLFAYSVMMIRPYIFDPDAVSMFAPEKPYKPLNDIMANAEIFIVESDTLLDYPRPTLPNARFVGGLSVKPCKPLKDLFRSFVEKSQKGLILVSFGSTLADIPDYIFHKINTACKSTGLNVIWRSNEPSPDPGRILTAEWIPQNDILGHKNTKLFISHCGKNGQYESLYHSVPILCLPMFGDQLYNAERARAKGFGLKADMRFTTIEELTDIVRELITNGTYKANVAKASKLFRLLYKSPMKETAFWLDHVMEFGGGYMRAASQKMPLYQFLMLDVFVFLICVTFVAFRVIVALLYFIYRCLCCCCCKSKARKTKSE